MGACAIAGVVLASFMILAYGILCFLAWVLATKQINARAARETDSEE